MTTESTQAMPIKREENGRNKLIFLVPEPGTSQGGKEEFPNNHLSREHTTVSSMSPSSMFSDEQESDGEIDKNINNTDNEELEAERNIQSKISSTLSDNTEPEQDEKRKQMKIIKSTLRMNRLALLLFFLIVPREVLNIVFKDCNNSNGECGTYFKLLMPISTTQLLVSLLQPFIVLLLLEKII